MTPRENLLTFLKHGIPEWIPCSPHIANLNNIPGQLPVDLLNGPIDRFAISKYMGGDLLYEIRAVKTIYDGSIVSTRTVSEDIAITELETPVGRLVEKRKEAVVPAPAYSDTPPGFALPPDMKMSTVTEHFVKETKDYEALGYLYKSTKFEFDLVEIKKNISMVGDDGVAVLSGPSSPFYNLISACAGLERIIYDLIDCVDEVEKLISIMAGKNYEWYEQAAMTDIEVIRCTEDLDTNLISPALFEKYSVPVLRNYAEICHAHNKLLMLHMCGRIKEFLPLIRDTGVDALHCLCPPETGNTPLKVAREIFGKKVAIMARVDPPVLLSKKPSEVSAAVEGMLKEVSPGDNFMIILPCGRAPMANLKAVMDTVKRNGKYPLR